MYYHFRANMNGKPFSALLQSNFDSSTSIRGNLRRSCRTLTCKPFKRNRLDTFECLKRITTRKKFAFHGSSKMVVKHVIPTQLFHCKFSLMHGGQVFMSKITKQSLHHWRSLSFDVSNLPLQNQMTLINKAKHLLQMQIAIKKNWLMKKFPC